MKETASRTIHVMRNPRSPPNSVARFACPGSGEAMGARYNTITRVLLVWPEDENASQIAHRLADSLEGRWSDLAGAVEALADAGASGVVFEPSPRAGDTLAGVAGMMLRRIAQRFVLRD